MFKQVTTQQEIFSIYRMLENTFDNDFVSVEQRSLSNLYDVLNLYIGGTEEDAEAITSSVTVKEITVALMLFYFEKQDIFEEIKKRTALIGRSRFDKNGNSQLERIAMTNDEKSIFESFFVDSTTKVFEAMSAFTRIVSGAFLLEHPSGRTVYDESHGYFTGDVVSVGGVTYNAIRDTSPMTPLGTSVLGAKVYSREASGLDLDILVCQIGASGLFKDWSEVISYNNTVIDGFTWTVPTEVELSLISMMRDEAGLDFVVDNYWSSTETEGMPGYSIVVNIGSGVPSSVLQTEQHPFILIRKYKWEDSISLAWENNEYYYTDDKVEYITIKPEWFNDNFQRSIDNNIFEAIVNYIIHKWFTIVLPEEASYYYSEYDRYYHDIVRSHNQHNKPLRRGYKLF